MDEFDFELPAERIALEPARPREAARVLVSHPDGRIEDRTVAEAPEFFGAGDLLVVNDTKVIPAALAGFRPPRAEGPEIAVEANLLERLAADRWRALAKPGRRLKPGDALRFGAGLKAIVESKGEGGEIVLAFDRAGAELDAAIQVAGETPLPPYILAQRARRAEDAEDYQTVFARESGAVAAPTAGLHFTDALLGRLDAAGVARASVTLHVGAGTFLPVKAERAEDHVMHAEWRRISPETADAINVARGAGRRVVAVGTTVARSLESAVDDAGSVLPLEGETRIFLRPGCHFRAVDGLWTNFHLPRSTLFMLVAAFAGLKRARAAYAHAIANEYRFYSFGDACLFWR